MAKCDRNIRIKIIKSDIGFQDTFENVGNVL